MVKSDFSSLFSKAFDEKKGVVQADISTFVTKTAAGEMISNATIQADQISLTGHCMNFSGGQITITTDNFKLDSKVVFGVRMAHSAERLLVYTVALRPLIVLTATVK